MVKFKFPKFKGKKLTIDFQQSAPAEYDKNQGVYQLLDNRLKHWPDKPYLKYLVDEKNWEEITAREFDQMAIQVAKGLVAKGVKPQDAVAIMGKNSLDWLLVDAACTMIGLVIIPIYETNSIQQINYIIQDTRVRLSFVDNAELNKKVESVITKNQDYLGTYVFEKNAIKQLIALGKKVSTNEIEELKKKVGGDDLLSIIYTSGSTGTAKGSEITHNALNSSISEWCSTFSHLRNPKGVYMSYVPLSLLSGFFTFWAITNTILLFVITNYSDTLLNEFKVIKPTATITVPRLLEKIYSDNFQRSGGFIKSYIFKKAVNIAISFSKKLNEPEGVQIDVYLMHKLFDRLIYANIRHSLGNRMEYILAGGAPVSSNLSHFFRGIGIPVLQTYGMTETALIFSCRENANRIGTVGYPFPSVEYKIETDGNLLVKSPQLFKGYHNDPEATESVFVDGWFKTGDLAQQNSDGSITLIGRSKDIIITAGGKTVSPLVMEGSLKYNLLISQAVLVGDRKPYISCLITLDPEQFEAWQKKNNLKISKHEIPTNPVLRGEIQRMIDKTNALVSRAESIKKFEILPDDFTEENGLLTASMKLKRNKVYEKYQDLIETKLYGK